MDGELAVVISSIAVACKQVRLLERFGGPQSALHAVL